MYTAQFSKKRDNFVANSHFKCGTFIFDECAKNFPD